MSEDPFVQKRVFQQLPLDTRHSKDAILNSNYLVDIPEALETWSCSRIVLVHSKALDNSTRIIKDLQSRLGDRIVATKSGVGAHSPYPDIIHISRLLHDHKADCLISIGSSSYSDACKIARLLDASFSRGDISLDDVENLVDQEKGVAKILANPKVRLVLVPTSLSASEWNHISSATNPKTHKKQHFDSANGAPDLILLDSHVAATSPRTLWLSSGMRAVDHCVETMCNAQCTDEPSDHMEKGTHDVVERLEGLQGGRRR